MEQSMEKKVRIGFVGVGAMGQAADRLMRFIDTALERYPVGYRHLAYLQEQQGFTVKPDMPGLVGPEVDALYASGRQWLAGDPLDR